MTNIYFSICAETRGVSGFLKLGGQVVMRPGNAAGGAFYTAKKWGRGAIVPPCSPFTYVPESEKLSEIKPPLASVNGWAGSGRHMLAHLISNLGRLTRYINLHNQIDWILKLIWFLPIYLWNVSFVPASNFGFNSYKNRHKKTDWNPTTLKYKTIFKLDGFWGCE